MRQKFKLYILTAIAVVVACLGWQATAYAEPYTNCPRWPNYDSNNMWTLDTERCFYGQKGDTVIVGEDLSNQALPAGQHWSAYEVPAGEWLPIYKWTLAHPTHTCIHNSYVDTANPEYPIWHRYNFTMNNCYRALSPGWNFTCSICGGECGILFYAKEGVINNIDKVLIGSSYISQCAWCDNLEQGVVVVHTCRRPSPNRYYIVYNGNGATGGGMANSTHYWFTGTTGEHDGETVTQSLNLTPNSYTKYGYHFVGWSTTPDGAKVVDDKDLVTKALGSKIPEEDESFTLYAVWEINSSSLVIDAGEGLYNGQKTTTVTQNANTNLSVDDSKITPPAGYTVTFNGNGGSAEVSRISSTKKFAGWKQSDPFHGNFYVRTYTFPWEGSTDTLTASYTGDAITLPGATKSGYTFTGWYTSAAGANSCSSSALVGSKGQSFTPTGNITLYAGFANLSLTTTDNYTANGGVGSANLKWTEPDTFSKSYKVYQSSDGSNFTQINAATVNAPSHVTEDKTLTSTQNYTVPADGFYTFTVNGSAGQGYGSKVGGKGAVVTGTVYLPKGTVLTIGVGGQTNGTCFGKGGTASYVYNQTTGTYLLVAGGGAGASPTLNGGDASSTSTWVNASALNGGGGDVGGGGGASAGASGTYHQHTHSSGSLVTLDGAQYCTVASGCYTTAVSKGGTCSVVYTPRLKVSYYGGEAGRCPTCNTGDLWCYYIDATHDSCGAGDACPENGHGDHWVNVCQSCGKVTAGGDIVGLSIGDYIGGSPGTRWGSHNYSKTYYAVGCGKSNTATQAFGGTSYINPNCDLFNTSGPSATNSGTGSVRIYCADIGLTPTQNLDNVLAKDVVGPKTIPSIAQGRTGNTYACTWYDPGDNGSTYWHYVKSFYTKDGSEKLTSNICVNTLTVGTKGYYYKLTTNSSYTPTTSDSYLAEAGVGKMNTTYIDLSSYAAGNYYLCVRPVDKNGNLGAVTRTKFTVEAPIKATATLTLNANGSPLDSSDATATIPAAGARTKSLTVRMNSTDNNNVASYKPAWTGRGFVSWNTKPDGTGIEIFDVNGKCRCDGIWFDANGKWIGTSDLTVYAQWEENVYYITYMMHNGIPPIGGSTVEDGYEVSHLVHYNTLHTVFDRTSSTITREGYLLEGWNTSETASTVQAPTWNMGATVRRLTPTDGGEIKVWPQWKPVTYRVNYRLSPDDWYDESGSKPVLYNDKYLNSASADGPKVQTMTFDSPANLSGVNMFCIGYTLTGWDQRALVVGREEPATYKLKQQVVNLASEQDAVVDLYPVWTENMYIVRYHNDQDGSYTDQKEILYTAETHPYLNGVDMNYTKEGYYIAYWQSADGKFLLQADPLHEADNGIKETFSRLSPGDIDGKTVVDVYPVWRPIAYNVKFDANGGSGEAPFGTFKETIQVPEFASTNTKAVALGLNTFDARIDAAKSYEDVDYYVIPCRYEETYAWPACTYTDKNSAGVLSTFLGWSLDPEASTPDVHLGEYFTNLTPERNQVLTLYAIWDKYPSIEVDNPDRIAYNAESGLLQTLLDTPSGTAISGTAMEQVLLETCVKSAKDPEDGDLTGTSSVYISNFSKEVVGGIDRPTLLTITFTVQDSYGHCTNVTTVWEIYSDGKVNILVK